MKLIELQPGMCATIIDHAALPVKALEMGILNKAKICLLRKSPVQKMLIIQVEGSRIALPLELARKIEINPVNEKEAV